MHCESTTICSAPRARSERRRRGLAVAVLVGACLASAGAAQEDWAAVLAAARRAAEQAPESVEPRLAMARALTRMGRRDAALAAFAEVRRLAPDLADGYVLPALLHRDEGALDEALSLLEEGRTAAGGPVVAAQLAFVALEAGEAPRALLVVDEALTGAPEDGDLLLARALSLAAQPERRTEAGPWFERALAAGVSHEGRARLEWARWASDVGDWQAALDQSRRATALLPDEAEGHFRLAAALRQAGDVAGAAEAMARYQELEAAAKLAERQAREVGTALNEAQVLAGEDRLEEALTRLDELPGDADARVATLRAKVLFSLGRRDEARAAARSAAAQAPWELEPVYLHALFAFAAGSYEESLEALERVIALDPELGEAWALRGSARARVGRLEDAVTAFDRALALGFDSPKMRLEYAGVLSDLGRAEESRRQLEARERLLGG